MQFLNLILSKEFMKKNPELKYYLNKASRHKFNIKK